MLNTEPDVRAELAPRTGTHSQQVSLNQWDRLPQETAVAYEAFLSYCDQGGSRSLPDVSVLLNRRLATIKRWSTRWNWQERCRAFDIDQLERDSQDEHRERQAMRRRQIKVGQLLQTVADIGIEQLQQRAEKKGSLGLSPNEIIGMIRVGAELERNSRGEDLPVRQHAEIQVIFGNADDPKSRMARLQAVGQQTPATRNGGNDEF